MTEMLALALALVRVCCVALAGGAAIGLTTDIENCESGTLGGCDGLLDTLRNLRPFTLMGLPDDWACASRPTSHHRGATRIIVTTNRRSSSAQSQST